MPKVNKNRQNECQNVNYFKKSLLSRVVICLDTPKNIIISVWYLRCHSVKSKDKYLIPVIQLLYKYYNSLVLSVGIKILILSKRMPFKKMRGGEKNKHKIK